MKQCTFQDNAWALFSDIKLHAILLCCFSVSLLFLDQDLGSTDTQKESQFLLKKEKVDEESNRGKLSAKLCNGMFSWSLDLEQDNI